MPIHHLRLLWILAALALIAAAWWVWPRDNSSSDKGVSEAQRKAASRSSHSKHSDDVPERETVDAARAIESAMARLASSSDAAESSAALDDLREGLRRADPQRAARAVLDFLKSGRDTPTKLPFVVGPEGVMESSPTLRTALLDYLMELDPTLALEAARLVMKSAISSDEYALALRNLSWNDMDGDLRSELSARFHDMLARKDWLADPSAGLLEAFDAAVKLADQPAFDAMARIHSAASKASSLARASFMAMDRMVLGQPSLIVQASTADPGLASLQPDLRASLISRLDPTDAAQRSVIASYLQAPTHGEGELDYFSSIFPNPNQLQGNWLLTTGEPPVSIDERLKADQAVLAEIERMRTDAQGEAARALDRIRDRLLRITSAAASEEPPVGEKKKRPD